jgi:hypothetical protein
MMFEVLTSLPGKVHSLVSDNGLKKYVIEPIAPGTVGCLVGHGDGSNTER